MPTSTLGITLPYASAVARDAGQARTGVQRTRLADGLEQREIVRAVRVEVRLREVEALSLSEDLRVVELALLPAGGLHHLPREHAALDLEPRAHHVRDAERARERLDLISERG
jgi:hypothetical protein